MANDFNVNQTTVATPGFDADADGVIDPGERVTTTITITNNSTTTNATNVQVDEALSGLTLVPGSIMVTPIAADDNLGSIVGNTPITFTAAQLLANDFDPDGPTPGTNVGLTISSLSGALNGTVVLNGDGSLTFTPNTGYEGAASFQYKVVDAQSLQSVSTATVSLTVTDPVWYVDSAVATSGDGSFGHAFKTIADLNAGGAFDGVNDANDTIFFVNNGTAYTGSIHALAAGQQLLGDGSALVAVNGNSVGASSTNTALNASGNLITLGSGNTISGFDLGNVGSANSVITGTNFGTLNVSATSINTDGTALNLTNGAFGAGAAFTGVTVTTAGITDISLTNVTGSVNLGNGSMAGQFAVSGGSVSTTYGGNITQSANAAMVNVSGGHTGTLTFNTGTLSATNGTGLQFDNADGTYNFNGTTTLNGGDAGVDIVNGSDGNFNFSTNTSITNPSGVAFNVNGGTGNIDYNGTISKNTDGQTINVQNHTGGTVSFDGTVSSTSLSDGINLASNTGGTINFTNTLTINTSSSGTTGFNATGGGTVTATGSGSTISSGAGIALNVVSTTIGANDLTFQSINVNGAAKGIVLNTTGSTGGLTVTGTGTTDGSGGTIQNNSTRGIEIINATGGISLKNMNLTNSSTTDGAVATDTNTASLNAAIYLNGANDVVLDNINISGTNQEGIIGVTVNNFALNNSTIANAGSSGASSEEGAIKMREVTGLVTMNNDDFSFSAGQTVEIKNTAGSLILNIDNTTMRDTQSSASGQGGLQVIATGTTSVHPSVVVNVTDSDFLRLRTHGVNVQAVGTTDTGSASADVDITGSTFDPGAAPGTMIGIDLDADDASTLVFNINNNTKIDSRNGPAVNIFGDVTAHVEGRINNNTEIKVFDNPGNSQVGSAVRVNLNKDATGVIEISNNTITNLGDDAGIDISSIGQTNVNTGQNLQVTIDNNDITLDASTTYGIVLISASNAGDHNVLIADVKNNDVHNAGIVAFRARVASANGQLKLEGFVTDPEATWNARGNTPISVAGSQVSFGGSGTFGAGTANLPTNPGPDADPLLAGAGGVEAVASEASQWQFVGIGDFNADGWADALLLRDDGLLRVDTINGDPVTESHILGQLKAGWSIVAVGDINNDGTTDIVLLNDAGTYQAELIQNNAVTATVDLVLVDGMWRVISSAVPGTPPSDPTPVTPTPPAQTASGTVETHLTQSELDAVVDAAILRWTAAGLSDAQVAALHALTFAVADMTGLYLGSFAPGLITLDSDAAGRGWYLDATPFDDSEFANGFALTRMQTDPAGTPAGHYDLLTTVMHEMGHALGLGDHYEAGARDDLMFGWLYLGERRLPGAGEADGAVAGSITSEEFLASPVVIGTLPFGKSVNVIFQATVDAQTNQLIVNPVNHAVVTADAPFPASTNSNFVTTTLDTLILGGTIWSDSGAGGGIAGDGIKQAGESGVAGVTLSLFVDADNDDAPDTPGTPLVTGVVTDGSGNYSFTGLAPGNYIVRIDQSNFQAGGALETLQVSPVTSPDYPDPDDNVDNDDNGGPHTTGQASFSKAITLDYNTEPTAGSGNDTNTTLDFGFLNNPPPSILDLSGDTAAFTEDGPAVLLDQGTAATVTDDQTNFNGGNLTVSTTVNGVATEDVLGISTAGTVTLSSGTSIGSIVSVGGLAIGTVTSNGTGGTNLVVTFNTTDATPANVGLLINALTYFNSNTLDPSTLQRTIGVAVNDGLGGVDTENALVNITALNDTPVNSVPGAQVTNEDTSIVFTGATAISISDDAASGEDVTLSVLHGTLTFGGSSAGLSAFTNGLASITLTGSTSAINTALSTLTYAPTADYNGGDQLTIVTNDNGNTGTGTPQSDTDTIDITINAVADVADDSLTTNEDNAITANVITGTNGASADNFENAGRTLTAVTQGANGSVTFAPDGSVTYTPNPDYNGPDAFTYTVTSGGVTETGNVSVTVNAVNDAPVLDNTKTPVLNAEDEDAPIPVGAVGTLVSSLVDLNPPAGGLDNVTDVDASPVTGIALTGTAGGGTWFYTVNGGANWNAVGAVSNGSARLLAADANTRLYYQPAANANGTISVAITFRAWDQSTGSNGQSGVNTVPNGDTTAFSTSIDTANITINAVNDVPQLTGFGDVTAMVENGAGVKLDANGNASVSDVELDASGSNYAGATLAIARNGGANSDDAYTGSGSLDLTNANGLGENVSLDSGATFIGTFSQPGDGTFSIVFNANATALEVNSVMRQIVYTNSGDNPPASVQIDFTFNDGNGQPGGQSQGSGAAPGTATGSFTVNITQVDDAPFLLNVALGAAYAPGTSGVVLSPALIAGDVDAVAPSPLIGLANATIKIESGFFAGDQLFVNLPTSGGFFIVDEGSGPVVSNISVASNVAGTLILSGQDTPLHYQLVLDAVNYHSTAVDPSNGGANPTRTITWQVNDGALNSQTPNPDPNNLVNATILHFNVPPVIDLDASGPGTGFTTTFTERDAPIRIVDTDVLITDPDNAAEQKATVVLTNAKPADSLSVAGALPGGIDVSIDTSVPGKITLTLSNAASLADYQTALGQIRFSNSSVIPNTTDRDITVVVSDGQNVDSNVAHVTIHVIDLPSGGSDFNADGKGDLFWTTDSGALALWEMNGFQISFADYTRLGASAVGLPGPDWHVLDTADVNGDGKTDVLWRTDGGKLAVWEMDGNHIIAADYLRIGSTAVNAPGPDWHAIGSFDADGDGKSDILWRTDSGALAIWELDGFQIKFADYLRSGSTQVGVPGADWHIVGAGDFDGDGKGGILWRTDSGALAVWELNGNQIKSANFVKSGATTVGAPGPDWHVVDVADFDGDGKADILWRTGAPTPTSGPQGGMEPGGGQIAIWLMDGNQIKAADYTRLGSTAVGAPGTDWHILGAEDYNGDGKADILWRTDSGKLAIWEMDGTHIAAADYTRAGATAVGAPGPDWHVYEHRYDLL